jgi:V-containing nitrogenase delta subunit
MNQEQANELFKYVQERCLWQFFSRSWDRQENIDGIIAAAGALLNGQKPKTETPMERLHYADAKCMVMDFKEKFPWMNSLTPAEVDTLLAKLSADVADISITKSLNHELNHTLY